MKARNGEPLDIASVPAIPPALTRKRVPSPPAALATTAESWSDAASSNIVSGAAIPTATSASGR